MNNYSETVSHLITFSRKKAMICGFFEANLTNSFVVVQ